MTKKILSIIIFSFFFSLLFLNIVSASDTLYEYCNASSATTNFDSYGNNQVGQTFTLGTVGSNTNHYITSVKLYTYRYGSIAGTSRVSIYNVNASGFPTGSPLCYVDVASNSFTGSVSNFEVTFSPPYALVQSSTKYFIRLNTTGGDATHLIRWKGKSGSYSGGCISTSTNGGVSWTNYSSGGYDVNFFEYGISNIASTITLISPTNVSTGISLQPKISIYANDTDSDTLTVTWRSNYTGSYVTYQVNNSFTRNTICRWTFTGANLQYKKYYYTVYVNDGAGHNISKWFCFTTMLMYMNISYTLNPLNNSFYNYTLDYDIFSTYLEELNPVLNLSFNKTCLQGYNTTTKLYFNNTYLLTYTFINGTKTFNLFNYYLHSLKTNTNYSWSINTTFYNLSYNRTYHFKFNILFINLPSGSCDNTSLTVYNNTVNTTGKYETSYNSSTGNFIWMNYTGFGGGNITGYTEADLFLIGYSVFILSATGFLMLRYRRKKQ